MTPRELIEEHKAFIGVYRARISRARQVKREYSEMLGERMTALEKAQHELELFRREYENADDVIAQYETTLEETTRIIADLECGSRGIMGSGEGTRPRVKKPGRLNKLLRLQRKLTALLEEDPDLAEYLDAMEEI